ncbi:hypothetical protein ACA910_019976 [Epithemia clementina (nom. ined.)]
MLRFLFTCLLVSAEIESFSLNTIPNSRRLLFSSLAAADSPAVETTAAAAADDVTVTIDPKEAVKLFGRLAEKYIMLDDSAGMCCYSACSDCEYRLPGGGYRMSDQSAARPKWIPNYISRSANNKEHTTKWSTELFEGGPALSQDAFVKKLQQMSYAPTLGGPYLAASAAAIENEVAAKALFHVLSEGKDVLTKSKMSVRIKQLAGGEEGLTWAMFQKAMGF